MDKIDQAIAPLILAGDIRIDDIPQEVDYWTLEDVEDLLPQHPQLVTARRAQEEL